MLINVYLLDSVRTAQVGGEPLALIALEHSPTHSDQGLSSTTESSPNQSMDDTVPHTPPGSSEAARTSTPTVEQIQMNVSTNMHAVPQIIEINENDDDDLIFVSEERLPQPRVIDLCSPADMPKPRRSRNGVNVTKNRGRSRSPRHAEAFNRIQTIIKNHTLTASPPRILGADCSICFENIQLRQPTSTVCGHMFCRGCITQAIDITKRCPICKRKLTNKQIHSLYFT